MPTLHELFDAASGGLPPLPDLAPATRRIVRRKQLAARTSAAVLSSALVIGAGTFALSVQHSGNARDAASGPPQAYSRQYVLDTLRSLWPNKEEQLSTEANGNGIDVLRNGKQVALLFFRVFTGAAKFPGPQGCPSPGVSCYQAVTGDGDKVVIRISSIAHPQTQHDMPNGLSTANRLHGADLATLFITGLGTWQATDEQLLGIVESPAYEQLIESAVAASSVSGFGAPTAGIPSDLPSFWPLPSASAD